MGLKLSPAAVRRLAVPPLRLLAATWRFEAEHEEHAVAVRADGRGVVVLLWHEALLPLVWYHRGRGVTVVVSRSRDGRYLADFAGALGYGTVLGSSSRGGVRALREAVRALRGGAAVAFTPDGPRGPRRAMKPGALLAAQQSGARVIPVHATVDRAWRLDSWDRFVVPRPWARIRVRYGEPFEVDAGDDGVVVAAGKATAELARLTGADR